MILIKKINLYIWVLYFKNDIDELPTEKEILIAIKKLDKIQKTSLKGKK